MINELKRICHFFEERIGLNSSLISDHGWQHLVKERMSICEIEDLNAYTSYLLSSPNEFQEFVELLSVSETWFFREKASLEFIADYAIKEWLHKDKSNPIRILSLPCSSGEEPFSIAMILLQKHFPPQMVHIDGIDISKKALTKAAVGEYSNNSFRTQNLEFRDDFFTHVEPNYLLNLDVSQMVHFSCSNLFEANWSNQKPPYDVIFCRNLLIYLNPLAQKKAIEILKRLLTPDGILVVSAVGVEIVKSCGFVSFGPLNACSFKYQKKQEKIERFSWSERAIKSKKKLELEEPSDDVGNEKNSLLIGQARTLADLGQLSKALSICHEYLKECNNDPDVYFLIGLIEEAQGDEKKSEEYFLKTLYLDPNHHEALLYLALLAEKHGEFAQAELFYKRAKRIG